MKIYFWFFFLLIFATKPVAGYSQKTYLLIDKNGKLNKQTISGLSQSLRALAAFYSAMGGTDCIDQQCALTTALGLGDQGSDEQKKLIEKYLPGDKAALLVLGQDCYLPPTTSSSFSNFRYLAFAVHGNQIQVNYELDVFEHGNIKKINGPDLYIYKNLAFTNEKRVLYAWTEKMK
jgi:hypothetical protein